MRKKTHEEYVAELAVKNPNVEVVGKYVNVNVKITHRCLIHDIYWDTTPTCTLKGVGCKKCRKEKFYNTRVKTHEQYVEEIKKINPNIEVIEKYIDARTPIKHYCKKHDILWNPLPTNVLKGNGCVECGKEKTREKNRKTHEQYIQELNFANPKIKVIDTYIDSHTPILHKCLIDGYEWYVTPSNILSGKGCPKCSGNTKRTQEEYVKEVKNINSNIEVIDEYINAKTPILHKCKVHNVQWKTSPFSILLGYGCPKCKKEKLHKYKIKTHEWYIEELKKKNTDIIVLGYYINSYTPILHKCLIDNYEWYARPSAILGGTSCPECAGNNKKTHEQYVNKVSEINSNIEVIDTYVNARTKIMHMCKKHNIKWMVTPSEILLGKECPECSREKISIKLTKTHDQYVQEVKLINPAIEVIDTYVNSTVPIRYRCLKENHVWKAFPSNILSGHGCPKCNESKGEKQIASFLDDRHIVYEGQKKFNNCRDVKPLPFDFYLPDYNKCIEFDGMQHYQPIDYFGGEEKFKIQQKHDQIKNEYCKNNDIPLLRISYKQNIEEELNNFLFI